MKQAIEDAINYGFNKLRMLEESTARFFVYSMFGGMFVGFGVLLYLSLGAPFANAGSPAAPLVMGIAFPLAICLITFAGGDLFTGNTMVFTITTLEKKTTFMQSLKLCIVSYCGNMVGTISTMYIYSMAELAKPDTVTYLMHAVEAKTLVAFWPLFLKGVICNIVICLLFWCAIRMKTEIGKIFVFIFCIMGMIGIGLEHSIANSATLSLGIFISGDMSLLPQILYSLFVVTLGNIVGGVFFVGLPYWFIGSTPKALRK